MGKDPKGKYLLNRDNFQLAWAHGPCPLPWAVCTVASPSKKSFLCTEIMNNLMFFGVLDHRFLMFFTFWLLLICCLQFWWTSILYLANSWPVLAVCKGLWSDLRGSALTPGGKCLIEGLGLRSASQAWYWSLFWGQQKLVNPYLFLIASKGLPSPGLFWLGRRWLKLTACKQMWVHPHLSFMLRGKYDTYIRV